MHDQLLYQQDPSVFEFEATLIEVVNLPGGRQAVVLDRTYFYPTGGGQEHDTGFIGTARVVDVFKDESNQRSLHVVEGHLSPGPVLARIDAERRLRHMQHHSAQHLLTQCILRQAGFETVSANINGYSPSTLDILSTQLSKTHLEQAEQQANRVIYENKPVRTYFVTPQELQSIPLRRPPKVNENIRIVEIDGFDYSPCGGTHVALTGSIGLVKVIKAERQNDKTRIHFVAGLQAFELFWEMYDTFNGLAAQLSTSWQELPDLMRKQADQLGTLQKELQPLRHFAMKAEAQQLASSAIDHGAIRLVFASFQGRPVSELRQLAEEFKHLPAIVAYLASYDGQKLSLVVTCGEGSLLDARQLLTQALAPFGGRGGGDVYLAQGGGTATPEQFQQFCASSHLLPG